MKNYSLLLICIIALLILPGSLSAQTMTLGSTFTYQGYLTGANGAVSGTCDFQFSLYDALTSGTQIGTTLTKTNVTVSNGTFSTPLDFGVTAFDGTDRYLQIAVRCPAGSGNYTPLTPRQTVTAAPYAMGLYGIEVQYNATSPNIIGGYSSNSVTAGASGAAIGGGGADGGENHVTADFGTVGGGRGNTAYYRAVVGGGAENDASGQYAVIAGDLGNTASGQHAAILSGTGNTVSGSYAVVPGGYSNTAAGNFTFAGGYFAAANHQGSFVWADSTFLPNGFYSTAANQFAVHAAGGIRMVTGSTPQGGDSVACFMYVGQGSWSCTSDRNAKANIEPIDSTAILNEVVQMPIASWVYKGTTTPHIGPMAQDFYAAFGVGENDTTISSVDADGVALAAIQGLNQLVEDQRAEIDALQAENSALKSRLDDIEARLDRVESVAQPINESSLVIPALILGALAFVWKRKG